MITLVNIRPFKSNVGNHAIHFALRQLIYEAFGRLVSIVDLPPGKGDFEDSAVGLTKASVHRINRFADGVIVGGGNLFENDALDVDVSALAALEPPLMLFSNSIGRIYNRFGDLVRRSDWSPQGHMEALLEAADLSLSRDSATHSFARAINSHDALGFCPTANLGRYTNLLPPLPEGEEAGALIAVRTPELMNIPYRHQARIPNLVGHAIDQLREAGHRRVRLLCNDKRDLDFATMFHYSHDAPSLYIGDVYEYLSLLRLSDVLVSFRLHASIPALAFNTPVLNLLYDERAASLSEDLNMMSLSLNLVKDADDLFDKVSDKIRSLTRDSSAVESVTAGWDRIHAFQLEQFRFFHGLVKSFISAGD